jgi:hypothetical protein
LRCQLTGGAAQATNPTTKTAKRENRGSTLSDLVVFFFMAFLLEWLNAGGTEKI